MAQLTYGFSNVFNLTLVYVLNSIMIKSWYLSTNIIFHMFIVLFYTNAVILPKNYH